MPADPIRPHRLAGQARFGAGLVAYLDSLPVGELAELLVELPSRRQEQLQLGVLMIALNERLPDAYSCCHPPATPAGARGAPLPGKPRPAPGLAGCPFRMTSGPQLPAGLV